MDTVGADPHLKLMLSSIEDAVGNNSVSRRHAPGGQRRLHRAGHRWKPGGKRQTLPCRSQRVQSGHLGKVLLPQTRN